LLRLGTARVHADHPRRLPAGVALDRGVKRVVFDKIVRGADPRWSSSLLDRTWRLGGRRRERQLVAPPHSGHSA